MAAMASRRRSPIDRRSPRLRRETEGDFEGSCELGALEIQKGKPPTRGLLENHPARDCLSVVGGLQVLFSWNRTRVRFQKGVRRFKGVPFGFQDGCVPLCFFPWKPQESATLKLQQPNRVWALNWVAFVSEP